VRYSCVHSLVEFLLRLRFGIYTEHTWESVYTAFCIRTSTYTLSLSYRHLFLLLDQQLRNATQLFQKMSLIKRKALDAGLQRRVRARREAIEEVESSDSPSDNGDNPASDDEVNSDAEEFAEEVCTIRLPFELLLTVFPV